MKKTNCPNLAKNLIILLILSLVFVVLFSGSIYALSSDNINLQGKIVRNDTSHEGMNVIPGSPACVVNGPSNDTCDFRVSYYTALTGGTLLLTEDFTNVEIGQFDGVFELSLGSGTVTTTVQCRDGTCNSPSEVISEYGDLYIELQFAPDGSTLTETFTRMPLEASPYAIFSKFAEGAHDAFKLSTSISNESLENPSVGMIYFDTGSSQLKVYNGAEWQELSAGTSSSLWTDAGTYSYLTSTTDDLVLGGSSFSTGRFVFDMDGGSGSYFDVFNNDHSNKLFTILNSGNVGIGTATPGAKLEVGGAASTITNSTGNLTISTGGGNGNILLMPNGTGNVGIGTTNPTEKLEVNGTIRVDDPATGIIADLSLTRPYYGRLNYAVTPNNGKSEVRFVSKGATSGTGQTYFVVASTEIGDTGNNLLMGVASGRTFITNALNYSTAGTLHIGGVSWAGDGVVQVSGVPTDATGKMTVMGNVGIGTTSPAQKLDVLGGIKLGTTSNINNVLDTQAQSGAPSGNIYWGNSPLLTSANLGTFGVATISNSDGTLTISPTTGNVIASLNLSHANTWTGAQTFNANTYFPGSGIWNTSGNVGIGTTNTNGYKLNVAGDMYAYNFNQKSFSLAVPANIGDAIEFASVTNTNFSSNVEIWLTIHSSGYAQSKRYIVPVQYNGTGGVWHKALPISTTGVYSGNDAEIDVKISAQVATFRIRRTAGATAGTASITLAIGGDTIGTTISPSSTTYTAQVVTVNYAPTSLTMRTGKTGINNDIPNAYLDIMGTTEQLRVGYDSSNYFSTTVSNTGLVTFNIVGSSNTLSLASGDSFNLVSGNVQIGSTTILTSGRLVQAANGSVSSPAFSFSSDTNTGMYGTGSDILRLVTAGADRVTINASGNVGIGTTSPTAYLHLKAGTSSANTAPLKFTTGANLATPESGAMEWDGSRLYITNTTPTRNTIAYLTDIAADTDNYVDSVNFNTGDGVLTLGRTGALSDLTTSLDGRYALSSAGMPTGTEGQMLYNNAGVWTSFSGMYWDDTNNRLGIGTTTPSEKLEIVGRLKMDDETMETTSVTFDGDTSAGLKLSNPRGYITLTPLNTGWAHIYTDRSNFIFDKPVYSIANAFSSYNNDLQLRRVGTTEVVIGSTRTTITDNLSVNGTSYNYFSGNIGIGTTSPTAYLHLKAGTSSANTAPLKFTTGANLATPESGAMEWDGSRLYITNTTPTRNTIAYTSDIPASDNYGSWIARADTGADQSVTSGYVLDFEGSGGVATSITANKITIGTTGVLEDLNTLGAATVADQFIVSTAAGTFAYETGVTARTSLGATTVGSNLFTLANPSAVTFLRINADNSISTLDAASFRTAIGAGTGNGTVTSVATGTGLTGGTITTTGTISLDYSNTLGSNGLAANNTVFGSTGVLFEGSSSDTSETLLTVTNPTADNTITLPNSSGTIALTSDIPAGHDPVTLSGENYLSLNVQQITANKINLTSNVTGILPIGSGGTNSTTYTSNQFLWYNGTSIVASGYNQSSFASSSHSHNWSQITNGSGIYMDYRPNNTACGSNQVLKYDTTYSRWICADDNAGTGDNWGSQVVITNSTLTGNGTSGSPLGIALSNANTWTGMQTFRGLTVENATTTYDRILITAASVGTARYNGTLTNADLTAARTWTLPNNSGTIALTSDIPAGGFVSGSGSAGQVSYWSGTTSITGSINLWWDSTNSRLGIGTNTPQASLSVRGLVYQTGLRGSTYFGENAGRVDDLTDNYNTGIGYNSLYSNTSGRANAALGYYSLYLNTTGYANTAVGYRSLYSNTTGTYNTALGYDTLYSNTTGDANTALGYYTLYSNTTGINSIAIGYFSLYSNTSGGYNTALGNYSLGSNTTGYYNTALGAYSLYSNTTGFENTAVGKDSLYTNTTGYYNTAVGHGAGRYQADGTTALTNAKYSIYIGHSAKGKNDYDNNSIVIGYNAIGLGANTVVLGNDSIVTTALKGSVGIGVTAPTYRLQLPNTANNAGKGQANAWVTYSDISLKENIQTISGGLDKIMALRGVTFDWKGQGVASSGFIAQEVEPIIPDLVSTDINGIKSLDYGRFTPYLVEAIKEQQLQIQTAYNRIEQLENINENKIRSITTPGWYRISKLDTNDDHSNIKINNTSVGSSQNLVLSIDSTLNNQNINIVSNLTTGEYDITKARINNESGVKYLEIYIPEVNENKISVKITESSNWIATDIVQITEEVNNAQEYALSGILFGISDKLEVEEDNVKIAGDLLSLSVNSSIGDSANRWNDIYAKGTIRLGSGADGEGAIRFNVQTKTLEFSNNGVEWLSVGDLSSQMTISPEYAGAILFADGSDNSGIMTSDAVEEGGSFKNYYEWVSNKDTPQDYDILVRITLPADFLSWKEDAIYLDFMTENSVNTDNNSVGLSLIGNSGTDVQISGGISKIAGAWERMSIKGADITQCNSAGGTCTLRISLTSSMEYFTRVGDITLNYNRSL